MMIEDGGLLLAVDPGQNKTGLVIVNKEAEIILKKIIKSSRLKTYLLEISHKYNINKVLVGDGTCSGVTTCVLNEIEKLPPPIIVSEKDSTIEAAERYWQENPPGGFKALLAFFFSWRPEAPIDDYAAQILAERYLEKSGDKNDGKK